MNNFFTELESQTAKNRDLMYSADVFAAVESGTFTRQSYSYFLTQAYHHVKHTVPLLMSCGARLGGDFEWLRKAIVEYIEEEYGHEQWILNDLETLGVEKSNIIQSKADENIELMVAFLYDAINRLHPTALLGMIFMLESTSTRTAASMAEKIRNNLSLRENAFSYLMSHGELDIKHIDFFKNLVNRISDAEQQSIIIHSANMCYRLYTRMLNNIPGLTRHDGGDQYEAA